MTTAAEGNAVGSEGPGPVVVGVDGSPNADAAVAFAAGEAAARGTTLTVVAVCHQPTVADAPLSQDAFDAYESSARDILDEAVAHARRSAPGLDVEGRLERGAPSVALINAASGALQLVVGQRGHGGFVGLLLGSVSSQVVHHAPCPVTIVPAPSLG